MHAHRHRNQLRVHHRHAHKGPSQMTTATCISPTSPLMTPHQTSAALGISLADLSTLRHGNAGPNFHGIGLGLLRYNTADGRVRRPPRPLLPGSIRAPIGFELVYRVSPGSRFVHEDIRRGRPLGDPCRARCATRAIRSSRDAELADSRTRTSIFFGDDLLGSTT